MPNRNAAMNIGMQIILMIIPIANVRIAVLEIKIHLHALLQVDKI